jgi:DNA-binding MarR family transcriptional regulator
VKGKRGEATTEGERGAAVPDLPCACASLRRASRAVSQLYDGQLRASGLTASQFTLLQVLERAGAVTQGRLGRILVLDSTTLTRTLRTLEKRGWIRRREGEDRRERRISLTAAGRARYRRALPAWTRAQATLRAGVGRRAWANLLAELARVAGTSRPA